MFILGALLFIIYILDTCQNEKIKALANIRAGGPKYTKYNRVHMSLKGTCKILLVVSLHLIMSVPCM